MVNSVLLVLTGRVVLCCVVILVAHGSCLLVLIVHGLCVNEWLGTFCALTD